jgi:TolB-like protein/Flp pilus assembly protein TadD
VSPRKFFTELKRRNIYKVAIAYGVVAWLLMQIASQIFPFFEIPNWVVRLVVLLLIFGFPVAVVIAWAFELTPEGIKRTEAADAAGQRSRGIAWIYVVTIGVALSLGLFLVVRYTASRKQAEPAELPAKSIAVLPFDNLSRDQENAYFAEGIQDEILTRLAKIADLKVISRTSTEKYKSAPENLREIAKQLGVSNILEGSVQKVADKVRVSVQLINAASDAHLWAEIYDRKLTDIFKVESDIAKTIAETLQAKLTGSEEHAISTRPTEDPAAYQLYLKGRFFWGRRSGNNIPKAIEYFKEAIAHDPNYALAYAGLAEAYIILPTYTPANPQEVNPKAKEAALKALEIDDTLSEAHNALAQILFFDLDFAGAIKESQRAIALNPNYATAHHWYATGPLQSLGRFDEAIAEGARAIDLDPLSPVINVDQGINYILAGRYDEAISQIHKALEIDPEFGFAHSNLGIALELKGNVTSAITEFKRGHQLSGDPPSLALLGNLYGRTGNLAEAAKVLAELEQLSKQRYVPAYAFAVVQVGLGNKAEALRWLEKSYTERSGGEISAIKVDPLLAPLRGDPLFEALVQKVFAPKNSESGARERSP